MQLEGRRMDIGCGGKDHDTEADSCLSGKGGVCGAGGCHGHPEEYPARDVCRDGAGRAARSAAAKPFPGACIVPARHPAVHPDLVRLHPAWRDGRSGLGRRGGRASDGVGAGCAGIRIAQSASGLR